MGTYEGRKIQAVRFQAHTSEAYDNEGEDWQESWSYEEANDVWCHDDWQDDWIDEDWSEMDGRWLACCCFAQAWMREEASRAHDRRCFPEHSLQSVFALQFADDDCEKARLWDIWDQEFQAHGQNTVDARFMGNETDSGVFGQPKKGHVSDVGRDVAFMARLLRAGFAMHFTNCGRTCWLEQAGERTAIHAYLHCMHVAWRSCFLLEALTVSWRFVARSTHNCCPGKV